MLTFLFKIMMTLVLRFVIKFFSKGGEGLLTSPKHIIKNAGYLINVRLFLSKVVFLPKCYNV